jgi:Protein of unknown function (DUF3143)
MVLPTAETPLYNHPLPEIEKWLQDLGCQQNREQLHCWTLERETWQAEICLEIEELMVNYLQKESPEKDIQRSFRYSLSRQDIESAVFSGP